MRRQYVVAGFSLRFSHGKPIPASATGRGQKPATTCLPVDVRTSYKFLLALLMLLFIRVPVLAQAQPGRGAPQTAKAAAPVDLTGYWVAVITEDWRFRMMTPRKGDYDGVPLTAEGRRVADTWDPAKDETAGDQCKAYGAPGLMRLPGRLHITWENDNALRMDTDYGMQTRLFHFGSPPPPAEQPTLQGYSAAEWEFARAAQGEGGGRGGQVRGGDLKIVTSRLRPGYLRKNGVPYSANAVLTETFDRITAPNGDVWLILTAVVEDPLYLSPPFVTSTQFKKLPDASGWNPTPCTAR